MFLSLYSRIPRSFIRLALRFLPGVRFLQLQTLVFSDYCPGKTPIVYVFANTTHNQFSSSWAAAQLLQEDLVDYIVCCNGETKHGYCGYQFCRGEVLSHGAPGDKIVPLVLPLTENVNTLSEAHFLVRLAKAQGWKKIRVCAPPFHILRAFLTTVSVALKEYPELKIYSAVGKSLNWQESCVHSQGVITGPRTELLLWEYAGLIKYRAQGDLASARKILRYMEKRDS